MSLLRVTIGLILLAHGIPKLFMISAFVHGPVSIYIASPLNWVVGIAVIFTEVLGGFLLVVGYKSRWAGLANAVLFAGIAFLYQGKHFEHIFNMNPADGQQHFEFTLLIAIASLTVYLAGPGKYAVDSHWFRTVDR